MPGMYREPRGTIYHPHTGETIPLGTLNVASYERPIWTYNKIVYIEKEGWAEALKAARWPERHDCAVMSSKGFTTRAGERPRRQARRARRAGHGLLRPRRRRERHPDPPDLPGGDEGARRSQDPDRQPRS